MPDTDELIQQPVQQQPIQQQPVMEQDEAMQQASQQEWAQRTQAMDPLLQSQRDILGFNVKDSEEMQQVKQSLHTLNQSLAIPMRNSPDWADIYRQYGAAIAACQQYITRKGTPHTGQGKARLHMVQQVLGKLQCEQALFRSEVDHLPRSEEQLDDNLGWFQLLHHAHAVEFDAQADQVRQVDDPALTKFEVQRGAASVTFMPIDRYDKAAVIVSDADRIKNYLNAHKDNEALKTAVNILKQNRGYNTFLLKIPTLLQSLNIENTYATLDEAQMEALREQILNHPLVRNPLDRLDESLALFQQPQFTEICRMGIAINGQFVTANALEIADVVDGASLAMHAAAFSRMGTLLHTQNLIAEARVGVLKTEDGKGQIGVVQRNPEGVSLAALQEQAGQPDAMPLVYSDQAILQLVNLQLLNLICGKINHNPKDCIAKTKTENGRVIITELTATHNEISFGNLRFADIQSDLPLSLQIMDDNMYRAIAMYTPELLTTMFQDLLNPQELEALIDRFEGVKKFLSQRLLGLDHKGNPSPDRMYLFSQRPQNLNWRELFANQQQWNEGGHGTLVNPRYL